MTAAGGSQAIEEAVARLVLRHPFFGCLLAQVERVPSESIPTLATNGVRIFYSPRYVVALEPAELKAVLLHEVLHIIYLHADSARRGGRDRQRWNIAADYAVNAEIRKMPWAGRLPHVALHSEKFGGMTAEQIYDALPDACADACRLLDTLIPLPEDARNEVRRRILEAYGRTRSPGRIPACVERWIRVLRDSIVPWRRILHRYLREMLGCSDFRFLPPNRRHLWDGRYLPAMSNGVGADLAVAVDTSGSIGKEDIEQFAGEIVKLRELSPRVRVLTCDAAVHEEVTMDEFCGVLKRLAFKGGGGTDFRPVFVRLRAERRRPDVLIYLTDGNGEFPIGPPQEYPVVWCLTRPADVPWGKRVVMS